MTTEAVFHQNKDCTVSQPGRTLHFQSYKNVNN